MLKGHSHGQTVWPPVWPATCFEVMFDLANGVFGWQNWLANSLKEVWLSLTFVGRAQLIHKHFDCVNGQQTSNLSSYSDLDLETLSIFPVSCLNIKGKKVKTNKREFLLEFIHIYKDHPALWKVKSREYANKISRNGVLL